MKRITPPVKKLKVNPLKIERSICPEMIFAARRRPNETALERYDINSIKTNNGSKPRGQPAGTNNEKNFKP